MRAPLGLFSILLVLAGPAFSQTLPPRVEQNASLGGITVRSSADVRECGHDLIEDSSGSGMRHLELENGSTEISNKGFMMPNVARCIQTRFDRRDQRIEALARLRLFGIQSPDL